MTKCFKCTNNGLVSLSYTKRVYCSDCFLSMVEKRIRKNLRILKVIKKGDILGINHLGSLNGQLCAYFLEKILGKIVTIDKVSIKSTVIINPETADEIGKTFFENICNKEFKYDSFNKNNNEISPLNVLLNEEAMICAKLLKIKGEIINSKESNICLFLNEIEQKYPGSKFALIKSINQLNKVLN